MSRLKFIKTEYEINPMGIETQSPVFSWEYEFEKDLIQTSYRVLVASDKSLLAVGKADMWDSQTVKSAQSLSVEYKGKKLASTEVYYVKVFVTTTVGDCESDVYTFETGLPQKEWEAVYRACPLTEVGAAKMFRRNFTIPFEKKIKRARAYVIGLGCHEVYCNGVRVGSAFMNPVISDYDQIVYYNTYDITDLVQEKNGFGVWVGSGWNGMPVVAADILIVYEDDSKFLITTKPYERSWMVRTSPITANTIFDGETYDARIEDDVKDWSVYDRERFCLNNGWYFGVPKKHDERIAIRAQRIPEMKVQGRVDVKSVKETSTGTLYDFGEILTGKEVIKVKGERGAKVILKFAEMIDGNFELNRGSLRNAKNTDTYILAGRDEENYSPRFSYRGFRYCKVTVEGNAEITEIYAEKIRTDTRDVGYFNCGDEYLNKLHKMSKNTEACNELGILTDCPQRDERMGWLNDLASRLFQTVNNFGMERFFDKITLDMTYTMDENGAIKDTAPYYLGGNIADPVSVAYLFIGKIAFERYGDVNIIKENYANYKRWVDFLTGKLQDGLLQIGIYGDWCPAISTVEYISRRFNKGVPIEYISSCYYVWHTDLMTYFAKLLNKETDVEKYSKASAEMKKNINAKYYNAETGSYCTDVQSGNAIALSLGIVPNAEKQRVLSAIINDVEQRNYKMTCGNQAYRHLIGVLSENGRNDVVLKILNNREYPGWGYMLEKGATTVWERWEDTISTTEQNMHSYCHPMFGSYDYWFYNCLLGIKVKEGVGGMQEFIIEPNPLAEIKNAECSIETLYGKIYVSYGIEGNKVKYKMTVPSNCQAEIILKNKTPERVNSGEYVFESDL